VNGRRVLQWAVAVLILIALSRIWQREYPAAPSQPASDVQSQTAPGSERVRFEYYVLTLSWSPTHCAGDEARGRDDDMQCRSGRPYGFVLHGLWPQRELTYPEYCETNQPSVVADDVMRDVLEISPSRGLVQHEWDSHGTCSNLSQRDYFSAAAAAYEAIEVPPAYRTLARDVATTPEDVRAAFLEANPQFRARDVAATCRRGELAEMWFCIDKQLRPRACSDDVRKKHCGARKVKMRATRGNWPR